MLFPTLIVAAGEWACPCLVRVCCCEAVATAACCVEPEKAVKLVATSPINQTEAAPLPKPSILLLLQLQLQLPQPCRPAQSLLLFPFGA